MAHLDSKVSRKGVVACSAGNHAQGVAIRHASSRFRLRLLCLKECLRSHISSRSACRVVVLTVADFDAAKEERSSFRKAPWADEYPAFDDPYVIAGQGTIGTELRRQTTIQKLESYFCCVEVGLIVGIGVYVKRIAPHVKIIGVEIYDANAYGIIT